MNKISLYTFYDLGDGETYKEMLKSICRSRALTERTLINLLYKTIGSIDINMIANETLDFVFENLRELGDCLEYTDNTFDVELQKEICEMCNLSWEEFYRLEDVDSLSTLEKYMEQLYCIINNEEVQEIVGVFETDIEKCEELLSELKENINRIKELESDDPKEALKAVIREYGDICDYIDVLPEFYAEEFGARALYELWKQGYDEWVKEYLYNYFYYIPDALKDEEENEEDYY